MPAAPPSPAPVAEGARPEPRLTRKSRRGPVRLRGAKAAAAEISRHLADEWNRYRRLLRRSQRRLSVEAVHDLRVQTRRLLVCLDLFAPMMGEAGELASARETLTRRLSVLGPLRDAHVQLIDLEDRLPEFPEAIPLHFHLHRRANKLRREVEKALRKTGVTKLGRRLLAIRRNLSKALEADGGLDRLRVLRRESLERGLARLAVSRDDQFQHEGLVHEARIALKHLRYGAEALPPALRAMSVPQILHLKKITAVLGQMHDIDVHLLRVTRLESKGRLLADSLAAYRAHLARNRRRLATRVRRLVRLRSTPVAEAESPVDNSAAAV